MDQSSGTTVVLIGIRSGWVAELCEMLSVRGFNIVHIACEQFSVAAVLAANPGAIIVNMVDDCQPPETTLSDIHANGKLQRLPVFAAVKDSEQAIGTALEHGATDYITIQDELSLAVQKIISLATDDRSPHEFSDIDITPSSFEPTQSGVRVFVIEDDPLLRNLLSVRFSKAGFPCEFNTNGLAVINEILQFRPDVIVLDLMLPGVSGFEILQQIKQNLAVKDIPVMVFSNRDSQDDKIRAEQLGAQQFYVKAMTDLSELVTEIEVLAKKAQS